MKPSGGHSGERSDVQRSESGIVENRQLQQFGIHDLQRDFRLDRQMGKHVAVADKESVASGVCEISLPGDRLLRDDRASLHFKSAVFFAASARAFVMTLSSVTLAPFCRLDSSAASMNA